MYINFSSAVGSGGSAPIVGDIPYPKGISIKVNASLNNYFKLAMRGDTSRIYLDMHLIIREVSLLNTR